MRPPNAATMTEALCIVQLRLKDPIRDDVEHMAYVYAEKSKEALCVDSREALALADELMAELLAKAKAEVSGWTKNK